MSEEEFKPRPAFSIDWPRQYDCGPSDEHLHAIGQFIANYSMVEWRISGLFSHFLGIGHDASRQLIVETNISMAGMFKLVKSKVADASTIDSQASSDLLSVLAELDKITSLRNKIVHWQWGMNEGETATQSNLIKPRNGNQSTQISLTELRDTCLTLMKIFRAIEMNMLILSGQYPRELLIATHRDTSPEKLFRV